MKLTLFVSQASANFRDGTLFCFVCVFFFFLLYRGLTASISSRVQTGTARTSSFPRPRHYSTSRSIFSGNAVTGEAARPVIGPQLLRRTQFDAAEHIVPPEPASTMSPLGPLLLKRGHQRPLSQPLLL